VTKGITGTSSPQKSGVSLQDRVLLGVWVFSYAIILRIFSVLKRLEERMSAWRHANSRKWKLKA
jgi:hypothetical protein